MLRYWEAIVNKLLVLTMSKYLESRWPLILKSFTALKYYDLVKIQLWDYPKEYQDIVVNLNCNWLVSNDSSPTNNALINIKESRGLLLSHLATSNSEYGLFIDDVHLLNTRINKLIQLCVPNKIISLQPSENLITYESECKVFYTHNGFIIPREVAKNISIPYNELRAITDDEIIYILNYLEGYSVKVVMSDFIIDQGELLGNHTWNKSTYKEAYPCYGKLLKYIEPHTTLLSRKGHKVAHTSTIKRNNKIEGSYYNDYV